MILGLAVANTIAGAEAGAEYLSWSPSTASANGPAAASLEEVAVALLVLYGVDVGLDAARRTAISRLVEEMSGVPSPQRRQGDRREELVCP